jgi:hypothetical protein
VRDDRGVVVSLAPLVTKTGAWRPELLGSLTRLGVVSKAHPQFPLLLVEHGVDKQPTVGAERLSEAVSTLSGASASPPQLLSVGPAQPLVTPSLAGAAAHNQRLELVFVDTGR